MDHAVDTRPSETNALIKISKLVLSTDTPLEMVKGLSKSPVTNNNTGKMSSQLAQLCEDDPPHILTS